MEHVPHQLDIVQEDAGQRSREVSPMGHAPGRRQPLNMPREPCVLCGQTECHCRYSYIFHPDIVLPSIDGTFSRHSSTDSIMEALKDIRMSEPRPWPAPAPDPWARQRADKLYRDNLKKATATWHYSESWDPKTPRIMLLDPEFAAMNRTHSARTNAGSKYPTCISVSSSSSSSSSRSHKTIYFGFDNMWHAREPVYMVHTLTNEAKIWWQPKNMTLEQLPMLEAPEGYRYFCDVLSPVELRKRLVELWGEPPASWPFREAEEALEEEGGGGTEWGVMLTRENEDQFYVRVWRGQVQVAFNGTVEGMYDAVELVQVILGPMGVDARVGGGSGDEG